jgi:chromatin remodeling complex protein RSC6
LKNNFNYFKLLKVYTINIIIKMAPKSNSKQSKKPKQTKVKKVQPVKETASLVPVEVSTPTPTPTPTLTPVVATEQASVVQASVSLTIEQQFEAINAKVMTLKSLETEILVDLRKLQKSTLKHIKDITKKNRKKKVDPEDKKKRAPSGFAKPTVISDELCDFLGKNHGSEMARTEVTKHLTKYIREHELQDQANRRRILPDPKLRKLLNVPQGDEVTYFNLQKYMKVHFPASKSQILAAAMAADASLVATSSS